MNVFRKSHLILLWAGVLPLASAFVSYRTNLEHSASVEATLATEEFIRCLDRLSSTIQNAEIGQRGFLLTGRYETLHPYLAAEADFGDELARVEDLAAQNGLPKSQITEFHRAVERKMDELRSTIEIREQQGSQPALREVNTQRGEAEMVIIGSRLHQWEDGQLIIFQRQQEKQQRSGSRLNALLAAGILGALFMLVLTYQVYRISSRERSEWKRRIQRFDDTFEARVSKRILDWETRINRFDEQAAPAKTRTATLMS